MQPHSLKPQCVATLFMLVCLAGCQAATVSQPPSPSDLGTATYLPGTVSLPAAETTRPTPPLPTDTPSAARTVPSTITLSPTLTADQRQVLVRAMLETNGGCELPCWWGVVPGQSDYQATRERFVAYGGFVLDVPHPHRLFDYRIYHDFLVQDGTVQAVKVTGEVFVGSTSDRFAQDWHRYSLDQMLTRYGAPSQVLLSLVPAMDQGALPYYQLLVFYDHLGFAVRYLGPAAVDGQTIRACPTFEQVFLIILWLQSPSDETLLIQRAVVADEMPYFRPLDEATGMSIDAFYANFQTIGSGVCLEGFATLP